MLNYVAYGFYAAAAILLVYGSVLYSKLKKSESFGVVGVATVWDCKSFGVGILKKYSAEIRYKVGSKKYTGHIMTGFEQPLKKRMEVQIRYMEGDPKDVMVRGNDLYRICWSMAAVLVVLAGILMYVGEKI